MCQDNCYFRCLPWNTRMHHEACCARHYFALFCTMCTPSLYKELTGEFYREQRIMRTAEGIIENRVTKQQLVDALRAPNVGQRQLAQELEENKSINDGKPSSYYCTY